MKSFKEFINEATQDSNLVDDVEQAVKDAGFKPEVYDDGENFNVGFKVGDTEYYVRPNDKGTDLYYIDADIDDFESFKVNDTKALKSKIKSMNKDSDDE